MRKQYHFWPGRHQLDAWDVDRLIELSRELPILDVDPATIGELDSVYWFDTANPATVRAVIDQPRLIAEADIKYPVILGPDDRVVDACIGLPKRSRSSTDDSSRSISRSCHRLTSSTAIRASCTTDRRAPLGLSPSAS